MAEKVPEPSKTFQAIVSGYVWFNNSSTDGGLAVVTPMVTLALHDGMLQTSSIDLLTAEWGGCFFSQRDVS